MPSLLRTPLALLLALALALPQAAFAGRQAPADAKQAPAEPTQTPAEPQPPAAEALPSPPATAAKTDLTGSWEGWAKLTNDWPGLTCRYDGSPDSASVHLELTSDGGRLAGSVAIDLPGEQGSGCPPLRKRYTVAEVSTGAGTASFTDSGGNEWTLSVRRNGTVLQGLLAWREGGPEQPLAEGFTQPGGVRPSARLSGEVRLRRAGGEEETPAAAQPAGGGATPAAAKKAGAGTYTKLVGAIIGANVVGLGLLYAANKLGKGSSETGAVTCSARYCIVGAPNAPCFCENENIVNGASCGSTNGGQQAGQPCDDKLKPCLSGYSCNAGICEDRFGRCPY